jgi:hypothetical protein
MLLWKVCSTAPVGLSSIPDVEAGIDREREILEEARDLWAKCTALGLAPLMNSTLCEAKVTWRTGKDYFP